MPSQFRQVLSVVRFLEDARLDCALFGGWAEEALGLCEARPHSDIDLLLLDQSFETADAVFRGGLTLFEEIPEKRFAHKRAYRFEGTVVEFILVQQVDGHAHTDFWGDIRFNWKQPVACELIFRNERLLIATPANLRHYRTNRKTLQPWRWSDPASLVP